MKSEHSIRALCGNLNVSPSGYYDWKKRQARPGPRACQDQVLKNQIQRIHAQSRQTYGSPRS